MIGHIERTDVVRITIELRGMADTDEVAIRLIGTSGSDMPSVSMPADGAGATDAGPAPLDRIAGPSAARGPDADTNAGAAQLVDVPPAARAG